MSNSISNYEFDEFRLDTAERQLFYQSALLPLEPKVFDLLVMLIRNSGHLVPKDILIRQLWPDSIVEEGNLTRNISTLRKTLESVAPDAQYIETKHKYGYRFVGAVKESWPENRSGTEPGGVEPAGGAVALNSRFYLERKTDAAFIDAIRRQDSIVLVKGARQVGKTSLLARGLQQARESGARVVVTDFQNLSSEHLASSEKLFLTLVSSIADQLELEVLPGTVWTPHLSPGINFERYLRRQVFAQITAPIVWGLDEVDRLFACDFGSEVFGLFRSWHNKRALDPDGHWQRFTLAIAYATEAHLFITDLNQSPFNVGTRLLLEDFSLAQIADLNQRYNSPLKNDHEVQRYFGLVGGHPYLVHRGINEMTGHKLKLADIETQATHNEGLFGDHLRRLLLSLLQDETLRDAVIKLLQGSNTLTSESFYRLRSAGLILGDAPHEVSIRCQLYANYLTRHLV